MSNVAQLTALLSTFSSSEGFITLFRASIILCIPIYSYFSEVSFNRKDPEGRRMATGSLQHGSLAPRIQGRGLDNVDSYLNQPKRVGLKYAEQAALRAPRDKDPEYLYGEMFLLSLACPIGIMLAFGGKPALLVLCFGSLIAYIFDILGTIEVRIVTL